MRSPFASVLIVLSLLALTPALSAGDEPASCDAVNAARRSGAPVAEVAERLDTTRARIAACARLEKSRAQASAQRAKVEAERAARALAH